MTIQRTIAFLALLCHGTMIASANNDHPGHVETWQLHVAHKELAKHYVDAQIGKVLEKLKETGKAKDTIVVLWGDHGYHLGDKQLWGKHTTYEQSTRSPLIIANAEMLAGQSVSPVSFIDIFPTLCELTGLDTPEGLDGRSLVPILKDPNVSVHDYAASIYQHSGYWGIAIRTLRYRYVTWYKATRNKVWKGQRFVDEPTFTELYDYEKDPHERENLSGHPEYKPVEKKLAGLNPEHVEFTQNKQFKW